MPSCRNECSGLSNTVAEPVVSDVIQAASRTFTTNQPSLAGTSPEPESSSLASGTARVYSFVERLPPRL
jgi:hypothetical protein